MLSRKIYRKWMAEIQRAKLLEIVKRTKPSGRILDVGCGPGFLEELLRGAVATDIDLENLKRANGLRVLASGDALPFKNHVFDFVFCIDTVHLLKGMNELARALKGSGKLIVSAFCNIRDSGQKMRELKERLSELKIIDEFYAETEREWDAVLVVKRQSDKAFCGRCEIIPPGRS